MTYEQIKPYIEKGLVSMQAHPEDANVCIFNYTQECQFSKAWDEVTKQCRGLILNISTGEILARPFPKFFNYQEHLANSWPVPDSTPVVYEKLDGSLGILYSLGGKPWIATRGSFTSEQAVWATNWWRKNMAEATVLPGNTDLFEIIAPWNRIVVNYDYEGLVHLATINNATGKNMDFSWTPPVRTVKTIPVTSLDELVKLDEANSEGFVIHYPEHDLRMKIKFPEYVRLHKVVTGLSEIGIWEILSTTGDIKPLIEKVPDEFFKWVSKVSTELLDSFDKISDEAEKIFEEVRALPTRKEQALAIQKHPSKYSGIVFALLDGRGKQAADTVWKMIRPRGKSVFKVDLDL